MNSFCNTVMRVRIYDNFFLHKFIRVPRIKIDCKTVNNKGNAILYTVQYNQFCTDPIGAIIRCSRQDPYSLLSETYAGGIRNGSDVMAFYCIVHVNYSEVEYCNVRVMYCKVL